MDYRIGRTDADKLFPAIHPDSASALKELHDRAKEHEGPWRIKKAAEEYGKAKSLEDAIARLDKKLAAAADDDSRDSFYLDSTGADVTYVIREEGVGKIEIVSRADWGAKPAKSRTSMSVPPGNVYIHHTVTTPSEDLETQKELLRTLQQDAFAEGYSDIEYSFIVFNNGTIFEGRGWGVVGGHTEDHNSDGHGIAAVGNYMELKPTDELINAYCALIALGKEQDQMRETAHILGHRDTKATACPGNKFYARLEDIRKGT
jgi:N-acetylmuramoyl-L-alanine amidase